MKNQTIWVIVCILSFLVGVWWMLLNNESEKFTSGVNYGDIPNAGFFITTNVEKGISDSKVLKDSLGLKNDLVVVEANNGTSVRELPLYTKYLMKHGRDDHMQIGNTAMIGCFLSHLQVWKEICNSSLSSFFIFEEDAVVSYPEYVRGILGKMLFELENRRWSLLLLQARRYGTRGETFKVGDYTEGCMECTILGTAGYILKKEGACTLVKYAETQPLLVQVDAFIGLVNAFSGDEFQVYWTRSLKVIREIYFHKSTVQSLTSDINRHSFSELIYVFVALKVSGLLTGFIVGRAKRR